VFSDLLIFDGKGEGGERRDSLFGGEGEEEALHTLHVREMAHYDPRFERWATTTRTTHKPAHTKSL